jgi:hypothetical protein
MSLRRSLRPLLETNNLISRSLMMTYRLKLALSYCIPRLAPIPSWLVRSREITNFTYDLTPRNMEYLASTISFVCGETREKVTGFLTEPIHDKVLRTHIRETTESSSLRSASDAIPRFARRLGWYAIARCLKPSVIVETGVDKGLGSVLLCSALLRNAEEGHAGRYYGTDINPLAGFLLGGTYASVGKILYGDSIQSLRGLDETVDLFVNDSDHSGEYEFEEYQVIANKLTSRSIIISDNAHCSNSLSRFSRETNREFLFFAEEPLNHWYPGGGIGVSFERHRDNTAPAGTPAIHLSSSSCP